MTGIANSSLLGTIYPALQGSTGNRFTNNINSLVLYLEIDFSPSSSLDQRPRFKRLDLSLRSYGFRLELCF